MQIIDLNQDNCYSNQTEFSENQSRQPESQVNSKMPEGLSQAVIQCLDEERDIMAYYFCTQVC